MDKTAWIQCVKSSLLKAGLPIRYVTRTCLELSDHVEESNEESNVTGGEVLLLNESPQELSTQLVRSFRKQGFLRRIPPVLLLLLPLPLTILATGVYFGLSRAFFEAFINPEKGPEEFPLHVIITFWIVFYVGRVAVPLLSGLVACAITQRMSRPWGWAAAFFALQCWAAALLRTSMSVASSLAEAASEVSLTVSIESLWPHFMGSAQLLSGVAIALFGFLVVSRLRLEQLQVE